MMDDMALLRDYATSGSEKTFSELVNRHVDPVYSAAFRQTGDPHRAEEITPVVFIILARKASSIRQGTILSGGLFRTTRFAANDASVAKSATRPGSHPIRFHHSGAQSEFSQRENKIKLKGKIHSLIR